MSSLSTAQPARTGLLWLLLALVTGLCLPLVFFRGETNYVWDEASYYLPTITELRAEWPKLDLRRDSHSATAPGYQYILAGLSLVIGNDRLALRLANLAVSLLVLVVLWRAWPAATGGAIRFAALLPLAACNFFIKSASYVVTDNAALLAVTLTLVLTLAARRPVASPFAGLGAALAVFFRQSAIWLEAPLALRALAERRWRALWPLLPPLVVLALLVRAWGGLVPPAWQSVHQGGLVLVAGTYQLALLALLGPFFLFAAGGEWRRAFGRPWARWGAVAGLALALAAPSNPDDSVGRWGGYLWNLAGHLPSPGGRSLLFLLAAPVGGAVLGLLAGRLWREAGRDLALPWLGAQLAFFLSGLANRQVYHRYFEPTQLVLLVLWLVLLVTRSPGAPVRARPLLLLGAGQLCLTLLTAHGRTFFAL